MCKNKCMGLIYLPRLARKEQGHKETKDKHESRNINTKIAYYFLSIYIEALGLGCIESLRSGKALLL